MIQEVLEAVQRSAALVVAVAAISLVSAFLMRMYLSYRVVKRQKVALTVRPSQKKWVKFISPFQDMEFKGLAVLIAVTMIISYFLGRLPMGAGLAAIMAGLSFFTFTVGLAKPAYYFTEKGLVIINWYPPFMNRNMGFFRWEVFNKFAADENGVVLAGKKVIPVVCEEKDAKKVIRFVKKKVEEADLTEKDEKEQPREPS